MLETLVLKPFMYLWSINKIRGKKWERNAQSSLWDTWISPKLFVDRLNAWINRKLVSGEVRKLFFSVVKREFNSRHYNIMHFLLWICRAWTWWRFTAIKVCERLRSALDPIGHSPFGHLVLFTQRSFPLYYLGLSTAFYRLGLSTAFTVSKLVSSFFGLGLIRVRVRVS